MKTNRLLITMLLPLLTGCVITSSYTYKDADKYTEYSEPLTITNTITDLEIDWIGGSVTITKGETFVFSEEKHDYPLYYWNKSEQKQLIIQCLKSGTDTTNFDFSKKNLTVTIPYSLKSLTLDVVSASYDIDLGNVDNLTINAVSGNGDVVLESNKVLDFDTVSGSGDFALKSTLEQDKIELDSVSGNITLNLDGTRGFNLDFDSVSGTRKDNFGEPTEPSLARYNITCDTISANLKINKLTQE